VYQGSLRRYLSNQLRLSAQWFLRMWQPQQSSQRQAFQLSEATGQQAGHGAFKSKKTWSFQGFQKAAAKLREQENGSQPAAKTPDGLVSQPGQFGDAKGISRKGEIPGPLVATKATTRHGLPPRFSRTSPNPVFGSCVLSFDRAGDYRATGTARFPEAPQRMQ